MPPKSARIVEGAGEGDERERGHRSAWTERALEAWWNFLSGVYPAGEGKTLMSRMASLN